MTEEEIEARVHASKNPWGGYIDVTIDYNISKATPARNPSPLPSQPTQQTVVNPLLPQLSQANIRETIRTLSEDFFTRHRTSQTGVDAANWIRNKFVEYAGGRADVTISLYSHPTVPQPSVIAEVKGTSDEIVVVGGHFDSVAGGAANRAPGADDDASGVSCVMEAFRVLMANNWRPTRTVHFIAFAAEEGGLIGSRDLVARYYQRGAVPLMSMLQLEMNGWQVTPRIVVLLDGATHAPLTQLMMRFAAEYADRLYVVANEACGYGCSDHVPFSDAGYRATCIAEAGPFGNVNPFMHTANDLLQHLNMPQTLQHARLALAYVVELSFAPFA